MQTQKTYTNDGKEFWGKVGKTIAGRLLDGEEWSEFPEKEDENEK